MEPIFEDAPTTATERGLKSGLSWRAVGDGGCDAGMREGVQHGCGGVKRDGAPARVARRTAWVRHSRAASGGVLLRTGVCERGSVMSDAPKSNEPDIMEPTLWRRDGWTARVIKNEDDEGWAVEIRKAGLAEPVLISPWVMGRDKKNPKPFDGPAFATFVKTASEVLDRSARQRDAALKKKLSVAWEGRWYEVCLELVPDEYEPYSTLSATNDDGQVVAKHRLNGPFRFTRDSANEWVRAGFPEPR
jgi:hypothetical protein